MRLSSILTSNTCQHETNVDIIVRRSRSARPTPASSTSPTRAAQGPRAHRSRCRPGRSRRSATRCASSSARAPTPRRAGVHATCAVDPGRACCSARVRAAAAGAPRRRRRRGRRLGPRGLHRAARALPPASRSRSWRSRSSRCSPRSRCAACPSLLRDPAVRDAIAVTVRTNAIANVAHPRVRHARGLLARHPAFRGRRARVTLTELPLVLPPAVAGIALLAAFGAGGLLGDQLATRGSCCRSPSGRSCSRSCSSPRRSTCARRSRRSRASTRTLPDAARTLGAVAGADVRAVALPLAASGLVAGWVLAFARGDRRVRRDDHLRRQRARRDPDADAGDLRAARQRTSTSRSRSASCSSCSAPPSCCPTSCCRHGDARARHPRRPSRLRARRPPDRRRGAVALVGPSGAGKSTVLRAIAGLLRPGRGPHRARRRRVVRRGRAASTSRRTERSVGLVFQDYALFPHLTVRQNVAFGARERARRRAARALRHRAPRGASGRRARGGERQRVALARALARDPRAAARRAALRARCAHARRASATSCQDLLAELRLPDAARHPRLPRRGRAGRPHRRDRRRAAAPDRRGRDSCAAPPTSSSSRFTGGSVLHGRRDAAAGRRRRVRLDGGATVRSAERAEGGRVGVVVQPWDLVLLGEAPGPQRHERRPGHDRRDPRPRAGGCACAWAI